MTNLLTAIADKLSTDAGFVVSVEFPGCLVMPDARTGGAWWWGTANATWGADLMDAEGAVVLDSLVTDVPSDCQDAGRIALAIAKAMVTR